MQTIDDFKDGREWDVFALRAENDNEPAEDQTDDEPTGHIAFAPRAAVSVKLATEAALLEQQRTRIATLRPDGPMPRIRRKKRPARHPSIASPALAWWCGLLENLAEWPTADNDNDPDAPSLAAVMDRNPRPDSAETLMRQLPTPVRVATRILRKRHQTGVQAPTMRYFYEWHSDDVDFVEYKADGFSWNEERPIGFRYTETFRRPSRIGPFRFATERGKGTQFTKVKGKDSANKFPIYSGSVTHEFGRRVEQDHARERPEENARAVTERAESLRWFCSQLHAVPAKPPRLVRRRKMQAPIDWTKFAHLRGNVSLAEARAVAGLPPVDRCLLPGLPQSPAPSRLFVGMVSGMSASDGAKSQVRRAGPDDYTNCDIVADKNLRERFRQAEPEYAVILDSAATAGAFGDLVASNDNATGKRALVRAAAALEIFLVA